MVANRAFFRSFFAYNDFTAVGANPNLFFFTFEYAVVFNVSQKCTISFFVFFFDFANFFEESCQVVEAFFFSSFSKFSVHFGPFVVFAVSSIFQVFDGVRNFAAMQSFEPNFSMFFFVARSFFKESSDLVVAFFFSCASIVAIFYSCLGFTSKCSPQILFSFSTFQFHNRILL